MIGFICAIISGISMTIQGVFNTRLNEKIGSWETTTIVQATGLALALVILCFFRKGDFGAIKDVNKLYLLGGFIGVIITYTVMVSIGSLGTTLGIGTILVAQLASAGLIDYFGLFGSEKSNFGVSQIIGVIVMIAGILIFKWRH